LQGRKRRDLRGIDPAIAHLADCGQLECPSSKATHGNRNAVTPVTTGHFTLDTAADEIAELVRGLMCRTMSGRRVC
jgi:hypothetical protein